MPRPEAFYRINSFTKVHFPFPDLFSSSCKSFKKKGVFSIFLFSSTLPRRALPTTDVTGSHHFHPRRPRIDAFDAMHQQGLLQGLGQANNSQHQRARSLEHILDNGGQGLPNYWVATGATLVSRTPKATPKAQTRPHRAPSVENMLDESSLDTNSTSIPSYCTVDRRRLNYRQTRPTGQAYSGRPRNVPISSDDSSEAGGRPASSVSQRRIYKVNSFQQRPMVSKGLNLSLGTFLQEWNLKN